MYSRVSKFGDPRKKESSEEGGVALPFIVKNFLKLDGGELSGNLDLGGNFIKNLPDPVDGQDAVTKNYVDSSQGHSFFRRIPGQGYAAVKDLDMNENRLLNVGMPVDNREVSNKLYTDITANDVKQSLEAHNPFYLNTDKHKARGSIDMLNFKVEGLPMPVNEKDAANKIYVDTLTEDRRRKLEANNPFSFDNGEFQAKNKIDMKGFQIKNVGFPDLPEDVATVGYVDEANVWERKNGGFVAKDHIYLGRKKLGGLKEPIAAGEAANKKYVDEELKKATDEALKVIDEKTANLQPVQPGVDPAELDRIKTELEKNQPFNTRNQKTFNARGNINMKQKTLRNIPDPVELTDAVPLGFVNEMKEFFEDRIKEVEDEAKEAKQAADRVSRLQPGGGAGNANGADFGDMKGKKLINVGDPENPGDGVNKKYVDQKTPFTKTNGYYTTTHGINMDSKKITNLGDPTAASDVSNKKYVDDSINNIETGLLRRNGGFMAVDAIDMNSNRIKNVGAPVVYDDAVNKQYIDNKVKVAEDQVKIFNEEIEKLKTEDGKRKSETDRVRVLMNEVEEKIEENYKNLSQEDDLIKRRIYRSHKEDLIKGFVEVFDNIFSSKNLKQKIEQIGDVNTFVGKAQKILLQPILNEIDDQESKKEFNNFFNSIEEILIIFLEKTINKFNSLDDVIKNNEEELRKILKKEFYSFKIKNNFLDPSFLKINGHFLAAGEIDMNKQQIKNLAIPTEENDVVNKEYIDSFEQKMEKFLKERVYKFLGVSIVLIRGEAEGPIVGTEEIQYSNSRKPNKNLPGGFIAYDIKGKEIIPTNIYFGRYDMGNYEGSNRKKYPGVFIPSSFKIFKYGIFFTPVSRDIFFDFLGQPVDKKESFNLDLDINFQNRNSNEIKNYLINTSFLDYEKMNCDFLQDLEQTTIDNCNFFTLTFRRTNKNIERFFITFVCLLHLPDFNEQYLPEGFNIL